MVKWLKGLFDGAASISSIASWLGISASSIAAFGAGLWAFISNYGALAIILVFLFVFSALLHVITSILFIVDRSKSLSPTYVRADYDCSWGLTTDAAYMSKDPSNADAQYQFRIFIANTSEYPLRYVVQEASIVLEDRVPPDVGHNYVPGLVARWGGRTRVNFTSFPRGALPDSGVLRGKGRLVVLYGHPSAGYSRKLIREFRVKSQVSPSWDLTKVVPGGHFPAEMSIVMEDEESYVEPTHHA